MESSRELAKQVLSQLSFILKHLQPLENCESTKFASSCSFRGSLISKIGVAYGLCHHEAVI